ncbi:MAG: DnaJ domain-containing protein [Acidimicrobiia bacterium]|nr:DnaJ domain-containing protein [Acidimicrobiia bacterium]
MATGRATCAYAVDVTLYDVLGASGTASQAELRRAFVRQARRYHPDYHALSDETTRRAAEGRMRELNDAWEILGDVERRQAYDRTLRLGAPGPRAARGSANGAGRPRQAPSRPARDWRSFASPGAGVERPLSRRLMTMAPVLMLGLAVVVLGSGLVLRSSGTVFLAVFVAMLAAMGFVLAPVVAMTEGARRGRPVARARRR